LCSYLSSINFLTALEKCEWLFHLRALFCFWALVVMPLGSCYASLSLLFPGVALRSFGPGPVGNMLIILNLGACIAICVHIANRNAVPLDILDL